MGRSWAAEANGTLGSPNSYLGGLYCPLLLALLSRMLDDLALPGDGGGIVFGVDAPMVAAFGELCGWLLSPPPSMDEIDMLPEGRCDESEARSRTPAKGDVVGGPRGADPGSDDALEGGWGGEGGGICRDWKDEEGGGPSSDAVTLSALALWLTLPRLRTIQEQPTMAGWRASAANGATARGVVGKRH